MVHEEFMSGSISLFSDFVRNFFWISFQTAQTAFLAEELFSLHDTFATFTLPQTSDSYVLLNAAVLSDFASFRPVGLHNIHSVHLGYH